MTDVAVRSSTQEVVARVRSDEFIRQVALALPDHVKPERFVRATVTAIMQNPDVTSDPDGLFQSAIRAAQDGLIPDGREAAFVIVKDHGRKKVAYWPMVGGYRKIAAKHGITLVADVVREGDHFQYQRVPPVLEHRPATLETGGEPGKIVGAYAAGYYKDWTFASAPVLMNVAEIDRVKAVSRAADSAAGPWRGWYDRMAVKTAARRCFHELPIADLDETDGRILGAADDEADLDEQRVVEATTVSIPDVPPPDDSSVSGESATRDAPRRAAPPDTDTEKQTTFKIPPGAIPNQETGE